MSQYTDYTTQESKLFIYPNLEAAQERVQRLWDDGFRNIEIHKAGNIFIRDTKPMPNTLMYESGSEAYMVSAHLSLTDSDLS